MRRDTVKDTEPHRAIILAYDVVLDGKFVGKSYKVIGRNGGIAFITNSKEHAIELAKLEWKGHILSAIVIRKIR